MQITKSFVLASAGVLGLGVGPAMAQQSGGLHTVPAPASMYQQVPAPDGISNTGNPYTPSSELSPSNPSSPWYTQNPKDSGYTAPRVGVAAGAKPRRYPDSAGDWVYESPNYNSRGEGGAS